MFSIIGEEVLRQCNPQDGLADSIISDPLGCNFNPLTLSNFHFSHVHYGSEETWASGDIGDSSASNSANQLWHMQNILGHTNFAATDLSYETVEYADATNSGNSSANNFNLSPFYNRGRKIHHYQGLADGTVAPGANMCFHDHITRTLAPMTLHWNSFYNECWYFACPNQAATLSTSAHSTPGYPDPRHDVLLALMT
ncbi:hypothetical protein BOTNAR_0426g00010 [Botryotinia narcissicola]|uniref:feruloyl esterase n=1 Tax=Botryotinia narcissicola TaxID=278944 RepID=A0A4Z1HL92_9HELO|nr:hypothetical protein BOTNAR_0426g00010 [Botryotinia narcissicola]